MTIDLWMGRKKTNKCLERETKTQKEYKKKKKRGNQRSWLFEVEDRVQRTEHSTVKIK